jgi:hypothetical protein
METHCYPISWRERHRIWRNHIAGAQRQEQLEMQGLSDRSDMPSFKSFIKDI